jgi:hypothetical protein
LQNVAIGQVIEDAIIIVTSPFNDPAATIAFGTSTLPNAIFAPGDVLVGVNAVYIGLGDVFLAADNLVLTILPGASTTGAAILLYTLQ